MSKKKLDSNLSQLLKAFLLCVVAIAPGIVLTYYGKNGFKGFLIPTRVLVYVIGWIYIITTVVVIARRMQVVNHWRNFSTKIFMKQTSYECDIYQNYRRLKAKYPLATAKYEDKFIREHLNHSGMELAESVLKISETEWDEEEKCEHELLQRTNDMQS